MEYGNEIRGTMYCMNGFFSGASVKGRGKCRFRNGAIQLVNRSLALAQRLKNRTHSNLIEPCAVILFSNTPW